MGFFDRLGSLNKRIAAGITGARRYKVHLYRTGKMHKAYIPSETKKYTEVADPSEDTLIGMTIDKMRALNMFESIRLPREDVQKYGVEYLGTFAAKR